MTTNAKPRRRWFQYSLRTLLVLTLVVCIGMGWIGVKMQQARKEREAVAAIEQLGGQAWWEYPRVESESRGQAWLRKLLGDEILVHPDRVLIRNDAGMEHLKGLTQLRKLWLQGTQVTDAGLKHVEVLTQLQFLRLADAEVTDAGLEYLKGLTQLQSLSVEGTSVTDAGLAHLEGLTQLQWLYLDDSHVTDVGLEHLQGLPQLRMLSLRGTQVTDAGLEYLQGLAQL